MQGHAVELEFLLPQLLAFYPANAGNVVLIRNSPSKRQLECEIDHGLFCHVIRFAWLGLHEANDSKACATTACLNGYASLDRTLQGKHILSLTLRH